ncbi:DUF885 family protein [Rhodopirellula sp. JC740]|uniref:DUF885 family protein n=1 Tax=Rhodopirellula halodulae TaxID=2894198 RepID=A0ABS8NB38_9BACT|nr:DUF885 family protein [Rhodopirellula sp. JC740]MCC9640769.1 DUF885 family protein [Rhodopirellula sp. JC740]
MNQTFHNRMPAELHDSFAASDRQGRCVLKANLFRCVALFAGVSVAWLSTAEFANAQNGGDSSPRAKSPPARVIQQTLTPHWSDNDSFWFRRQNPDGTSTSIRVDAASGEMKEVDPGDSDATREAVLKGGRTPRSGRASDADTEITFINHADQTLKLFWVDSTGKRVGYGAVKAGETLIRTTYAGHVWELIGDGETKFGYFVAEVEPTRVVIEEPAKFVQPERGASPRRRGGSRRPGNQNWNEGVNTPAEFPIAIRLVDGKLQRRNTEGEDTEWQTLIEESTLAERFADKVRDEAKSIEMQSPQWSPDGTVVMVRAVIPYETQQVHLVESSPKEGGRAKLSSRPYLLPGDPVDQVQHLAFNVETGEEVALDLPWLSQRFWRFRWAGPHRGLMAATERGHQQFRLFLVDALAGEVETVINEESDTFIWTTHKTDLPRWTYLESSDEVIWVSEKDGYQHLYLVDLKRDPADENAIRPITAGEFVVRGIDHIDEEDRLIDLVVSGVYPDQDPYLKHYARVDFSGDNFTLLTEGDGNHSAVFSPERDRLVVTHSRVDSLPVHELRSADGKLIQTLATASVSPKGAELNLPTVFSAKGRDGETDIWGLACFPEDYDPSADKKYPVVEYIYAGPHDSHVPKSFRSAAWHRDYLKAGFIVVQIDGMGTANRSKAFHDVCWHNLKDAGFPDRIAWMKALAKEHPAMDLERVGIFGTSAGGQNTGSALLFHGDFYDAGVAACGCHDNRMDKASWNEQWMGYPVEDHYSASSNIDNAGNLKGDLFLIVGEMDTNVPPESTLRFADALIKANKDFDLLVMPGVGHSDGGAYGKRRTLDFFIEKLRPGSAFDGDDGPESSNADSSVARKLLDWEQLQPQTAWMEIQNHFQTDLATLKRRLPIRISQERFEQTTAFLQSWDRELLSAMKIEGEQKLSDANMETAKAIAADVEKELLAIRSDKLSAKRISELAPFAGQLIDLTDLSHRVKTLNGQAMAAVVENMTETISLSMEGNEPKSIAVSQPVLDAANDLLESYRSWKTFYEGYHPDFNWWVLDLANETDEKLEQWTKTLVLDEDLTDQHAETAASGNVPLPSGPKTFVFGDAYPPIRDWMERETTFMPAVTRRFFRRGENRDRSEQSLARWTKELEELSWNGTSFDDWSIQDQIDWHLLNAEVATQWGRKRIQETGEKLPPATSSVEKDLSGTPVGRERIELELRRQFIDHSPEELIELAEREYAIVRAEMVRVAQDMGLGDDWKAAVERMKNQHVPPGQQPVLIGKMARESVDWLQKRDWITVPSFADYCWRMIMMTPERQKVNPFFTGGEVISVSFPTSEMSPSDKRQSLRGNNVGYARATVHHELIPGHHLQMFMNDRYQSHRNRMRTPFWLEGLAVYWELKLYDDGFARTPEERMGMLVWRAHRCARIIFSLNFHLGRFSPDQCVDFLVDNVGFERRNATAEVRRSIGTSYPPLYQAAYMLGALQIRQLHREIVLSGKMEEREFHDAIMKAGVLPIAMLKQVLLDEPLQKDAPPMWRFQND